MAPIAAPVPADPAMISTDLSVERCRPAATGAGVSVPASIELSRTSLGSTTRPLDGLFGSGSYTASGVRDVRSTGSTGVGAGTFGRAKSVIAVTKTVVMAAEITAVRTIRDFIGRPPHDNSMRRV